MNHRNYSGSDQGQGSDQNKTQSVMTMTIASYLTLYIAPAFQELTSPWAVGKLTDIYGDNMAEPAWFAHAGAVVVVTFLGLNSTVAIAATMFVAATARYGSRFLAFA